MVTGGFLLYNAVAILYLIIWGFHPVRNGDECARGMVLGYLTLFVGGATGAIFVGYATYKTFDDSEEDSTLKRT